MAVDASVGCKANQQASSQRAALLVHLRQLAQTDGTQCLPWLIQACETDSRMLSIHAWLVDQAIFDTTRSKAIRHVKQAVQWTGSTVSSYARVDLGWILDARTKGARWSAWLIAMALDLGFQLEGPNPYC